MVEKKLGGARTEGLGTTAATRRTMLKGAAAASGAALGSAIGGFPMVWAQKLKDVTPSACRLVLLRHHRHRPRGELGSGLHGRDAERQRRCAGQSGRDPARDGRHRRPRVLGGREDLPARRDAGGGDKEDQALGADRPDLHQGHVSGRQGRHPAGHAALRGAVRRRRSRRSASPTARPASPPLVPDIFNADTLGMRPDLVGRKIEQLGGAAQPRVQGQGRPRRHPLDRHHGRRHGARVARRHEVRRQGQHDARGDRQDHRHADRSQERRAISAPSGLRSTSPST